MEINLVEKQKDLFVSEKRHKIIHKSRGGGSTYVICAIAAYQLTQFHSNVEIVISTISQMFTYYENIKQMFFF